MKKLLLSALIAGLFLSSSAMADVTISSMGDCMKEAYKYSLKAGNELDSLPPTSKTAIANAMSLTLYLGKFSNNRDEIDLLNCNGQTCSFTTSFNCSSWVTDPSGTLFNKPLSGANNESMQDILNNAINATNNLSNPPADVYTGGSITCTYNINDAGKFQDYSCALNDPSVIVHSGSSPAN